MHSSHFQVTGDNSWNVAKKPVNCLDDVSSIERNRYVIMMIGLSWKIDIHDDFDTVNGVSLWND